MSQSDENRHLRLFVTDTRKKTTLLYLKKLRKKPINVQSTIQPTPLSHPSHLPSSHAVLELQGAEGTLVVQLQAPLDSVPDWIEGRPGVDQVVVAFLRPVRNEIRGKYTKLSTIQ